MTLLAVAVRGRGLVDPAGPVFVADDEALLRGSAAFETLRSFDGRPFLLDRHLARLERSARTLRLPAPDGVEELVALVVAAGPPDHMLRVFLTSETLVATVAALPDGLDDVRARGLQLRTAETLPQPLIAGAKATSYAASFALRRAAEDDGADDVLFVAGGTVLETVTANIWWRHGDRLRTPSVVPGVLPGVTRGFLAELAGAEEGIYGIDELLSADEVFTTSSVSEVMPVVAVDGTAFAPGPTAARLQAKLRLRSVS